MNWNYTRKNYELLKTGLNNVVLPILLIVVNNIEQVVEPECSPQSGVTMLNNIVNTLNNVGSTTSFNPVFNKLLQLIIFGRVTRCHSRGNTLNTFNIHYIC